MDNNNPIIDLRPKSRIEMYLRAAITGDTSNLPQPQARIDFYLLELIDAISQGGGGGTTNHAMLTNRDLPAQHPISAIDKLVDALSARPVAAVFDSVEDLYSTFNSDDGTESQLPYVVGQSLLIKSLNVPDVWITEKVSTHHWETYTSDEAFIEALREAGVDGLQIGYFKMMRLEGDYATRQLAFDLFATSVHHYSDFETDFYGVVGTGEIWQFTGETYHDDDYDITFVNGHFYKTLSSGNYPEDYSFEEILFGAADAVTYTAQTLTSSQKAQARSNIDAISSTDQTLGSAMPTVADTLNGIANATVGQFAKITAVDANGNPTAWASATAYTGYHYLHRIHSWYRNSSNQYEYDFNFSIISGSASPITETSSISVNDVLSVRGTYRRENETTYLSLVGIGSRYIDGQSRITGTFVDVDGKKYDYRVQLQWTDTVTQI